MRLHFPPRSLTFHNDIYSSYSWFWYAFPDRSLEHLCWVLQCVYYISYFRSFKDLVMFSVFPEVIVKSLYLMSPLRERVPVISKSSLRFEINFSPTFMPWFSWHWSWCRWHCCPVRRATPNTRSYTVPDWASLTVYSHWPRPNSISWQSLSPMASSGLESYKISGQWLICYFVLGNTDIDASLLVFVCWLRKRWYD